MSNNERQRDTTTQFTGDCAFTYSRLSISTKAYIGTIVYVMLYLPLEYLLDVS